MALTQTWRDAHPIQPRLRQGYLPVRLPIWTSKSRGYLFLNYPDLDADMAMYPIG